MVECNYHDCDDSEPCPAHYVEVARPMDADPFIKEVLAFFDTGSPLVILPAKYQNTIELHPARTVPLLWRSFGYRDPETPTYLVSITVEGCEPELVEAVFPPSEIHYEYVLIGRNLMKSWTILLNGPEQKMIITKH